MKWWKNLRPWQALLVICGLAAPSLPMTAGQINGDTVPVCSTGSCAKTALLDSVIQLHFEKYHFNGCILLADHGQIVYENAVGYSDYENQIPMKEDDLFQLASVSKQFTAMAIMILKDRGLVNLDDTVSKYIPGFPYQGIKVSDLLHHTSALPEYVNTSAFDRFLPDKDTLRNRDLVDIMIAHNIPLTGIPGSKYKYCNTGYAMLSVIIENVSGMTYPEFMRKNIFEPLGMKNTYCYEEIANCPNGICKVQPYKLGDSKTEQFNFITGDKGIFSCLHDMFLWDQALYSSKLVSQATLNEAFTPVVGSAGDTIKYGYGWRIYQDENGKRLIWHRGLWQTFNPAIMRYVDDNKTIIILANIIPPYSGSRLLNDIDNVWLKEPDQQTAQGNKTDD
jgi:CubicO group peptidase (beta-lactamase class C family)